jgi:hypothetical protein
MRSPLELTGIESGQTSAPRVVERGEIPPPNATQDDSERREVSASPSERFPSGDGVETALASALAAAAAAGRFDVVAQLARELEARRHARAGNVVLLDDARRKGGAQ